MGRSIDTSNHLKLTSPGPYLLPCVLVRTRTLSVIGTFLEKKKKGLSNGQEHKLRGGNIHESPNNTFFFKKSSDLLVGTSAFLMHRSIQVPSRSAIRLGAGDCMGVASLSSRPSYERKSRVVGRASTIVVGLHCIRSECPHVRDALSSIAKRKVKQPNFVCSSIGYKTPMYTKHKGPDPRE